MPKMKWSLRSLLLLLTLLAAVLAWRYNQRHQILGATKQIRNLGGQIVYRWENPTVAVKTIAVQSPVRTRPETKTRTLKDGTKEDYEVFSHRSFNNYFSVQVKSLGISGRANHGLLRFFDNEDIAVEAVKIRESSVNEDLVNYLRKLDDLRIVLVCRDQEYFRVYGTNPKIQLITAEQRTGKLNELNKPFEDAKSLINGGLPDVNVIDGYWE